MNLQAYKLPEKEKRLSKRSLIIRDIIDQINLERPTKYKDKKGNWKVLSKITSPAQKRAIAIKVGHLKDHDLEWLYGNAREYKNRGNSFSKFFWGSFKNKY